MAHTSGFLLLKHNSLKCRRALMEEGEWYKPAANLSLFPVLVSSVQRMGRQNSIGVTKGSAGSHTQSLATEVSNAKAVVKTASMEHSSGEVAIGLI